MNSLLSVMQLAASWVVVNPWKFVGWAGNIIFGARFFIQWIASERAKKSVIPFGFWECSAAGSLLLLIYFGFYRRDSVGVLSALFPLPIYLRNLYMIYTHKTPQHPGNEPRPAE
ncbi:MAG: lipid-A-disaccharide synthase N-terminal domain-containing protein [Verrucomicrobiota bacterium]|nr:lipid-A-disaccharide synthase N-terminal domain-containing protein [Verrucomicrobiota bacterium]